MIERDWYGCYAGSWNAAPLVPDAFSHPAKVSFLLAARIYEHAIEQGYIAPGQTVIDPFGGIAGFAFHAMMNGVNFVGVELEEKFVSLGRQNIDLWQSKYGAWFQLGTAQLLQGDSRRLVEVIGAADSVISSPPYTADALGHGGGDKAREASYRQGKVAGDRVATDYGATYGQLGSMPSGDFAATIASPPFSGDKNLMPSNGQGVRSDMIANGRPPESPTQQSPGNLAILRADNAGFSAAISSPPYADAVAGQGEGPGARYDFVYHNGDNARKASNAAEYGRTEGNLGNMDSGGFEACVSSPPFEKQQQGGGIASAMQGKSNYPIASKMLSIGSRNQGYQTQGDTNGQLSNNQGESFWTAARAIVEQVYQVLKPGGVSIWVCGDFVRNRQRVYFGRQWLQLCEACGFKPLEWIRAWKSEHNGTQLGLFGEDKELRTDRVSFFRRLANEKNPEAAVLNEDVIIVRKPLLAHANGRAQEPAL